MGLGLTTRTFKISGMTCVNCQNKIERELKNIKGIISVNVNYSSGTGNITFDSSAIRFAYIEKLVENLGYTIINPEKSNRKSVKEENSITQILGAGLVIFALYTVMNRLGVINIFNSFPEAKSGMGYGVLFAIGLLTSVHCIAMCGGINLSQSISNRQSISCQNESASDNKIFSKFRPGILYNSGRVVSYTIIGGLVGALGSVFSISGAGKGLVAIVAGIFMVIMGLNMLNIFPSLRRLNPRMPKIFAVKINEQKKGNRPFYVGILNGLMPCGPLQAMQLYALSTGDPIKGAFAMLAFSLGTVPMMFGLGALSSILTKKFTGRMMTASAVLVVILGVFMFNNGISLSGYQLTIPSIGFSKSDAQESEVAAEMIEGIQVVTTRLTTSGYEPINIKAGVPVRWTIKAEVSDITGCNNTIVIPAYNIQKTLEPGENIIEFIPTESGTVPYSCWMGMIRSHITITE